MGQRFKGVHYISKFYLCVFIDRNHDGKYFMIYLFYNVIYIYLNISFLYSSSDIITLKIYILCSLNLCQSISFPLLLNLSLSLSLSHSFINFPFPYLSHFHFLTLLLHTRTQAHILSFKSMSYVHINSIAKFNISKTNSTNQHKETRVCGLLSWLWKWGW